MTTQSRSVALAAAALLLGGPAMAQTSLTIYQDGRVLVRRTVEAKVPKGTSDHRLSLGMLDPATVFSLDPSVSVARSSFEGGVDQASALRRSVGRKLRFRTSLKDTVSATVLGVDPERYLFADGSVSFSAPGMPLFPKDVVTVEPELRLSVKSSEEGKSLALGYFTGGASWDASYQAILGGKTAQVSGAAVVQAGPLKLADVEVQLLAGDVGRADKGQPRPMQADVGFVAREQAIVATEQRVGEAHVYTLPGRMTLRPGETSTVALFEPLAVGYEKRYVVSGGLPIWGGLPQYGEESPVPVEVSYQLARAKKTEFGDRPLPGGVVRLYQADDTNRLQLVGEAALGHTAPGAEVRLSAGHAFDLTAKRVQNSYTTAREKNRTVATADYTVTLSNGTDAAVTIDVLEERGGEWSVLQSSLPAEKLSSTRTRFRVPVPAKGDATLTYRVRVVW
jgi:hypothetical protein